MKRICVLVLVGLCFLACDEKEGGVPIVGVNDFGFEVEKQIDPQEFQENLLEVIESTARVGVEAAEAAPNNSDWNLEALTIGVGIEVSLGIFHFVDMSSSGRLRFAFSRNPNPLVPSEVRP